MNFCAIKTYFVIISVTVSRTVVSTLATKELKLRIMLLVFNFASISLLSNTVTSQTDLTEIDSNHNTKTFKHRIIFLVCGISTHRNKIKRNL